MGSLRTRFSLVVATVALFIAMLVLNEWLFKQLEFAPGINWVYLPAGTRLLCTLLFAEAGAIGLLLVSWGVSFLWFFPHDFTRAFVGGIVAALAPYLVFRFARNRYGLANSLASLTPQRLLVLSVAYALASPLLHHVWFALEGQGALLQGFTAMFVGDLLGTLIVLYGMKMVLSLVQRRNA
ncbi:MAG: hypothetical protein EOO24_67460 [Comamonadaceae bacterium]|nr:MAG: hypothetical protein EOO24_67460 [Comamonadaceae bacterium]